MGNEFDLNWRCACFLLQNLTKELKLLILIQKMTYYCSHISEDHKEVWHDLVSKNPAGGFQQGFEWAKFKQSQGHETFKIGLFRVEDDKLVGGCVILKYSFSNKVNFLYIPQGPILDYSNQDSLFRQWRALKIAIFSIVSMDKESLTTHIRVEPRLESIPDWFLAGFDKAPINLLPRYTEEIDLSSDLDSLLANMKQKCRYNIRLAERKGVNVEVISGDKVEEFFKIYETTYIRNKFEGKNLQFFETLIKSMPNTSKIYLASFNGTPLSASILLKFGDVATYLYGASSNNMRELMAPYAMHWNMIKDAKELGCKKYDFWGIAKNLDDKDHEWYGLTKFKKQFGGYQKDLVGSYDYIIQPDLYKEFLKKHELND